MERYKILVGGNRYILREGEEKKLLDGSGWVAIEASSDWLGGPNESQRVNVSSISSYVIVDETDDLVGDLLAAERAAEGPADVLTNATFLEGAAKPSD